MNNSLLTIMSTRFRAAQRVKICSQHCSLEAPRVEIGQEVSVIGFDTAANRWLVAADDGTYLALPEYQLSERSPRYLFVNFDDDGRVKNVSCFPEKDSVKFKEVLDD